MAKKAVPKAETHKESPKGAESKGHPQESSSQPQVNIGLVGHVDHGKTTLVKALSGKWTDTHSEELKRGITIKLGYADAIFHKCPKCPEPDCFSLKPTCPKCGGTSPVHRVVSFVDAPGHESLMATMLAGATILDGALLLISASEECPQPQTREHLKALEIVGIQKVIIIQNKVDAVSEEQATKNYNEIKDFLKGSLYENAPIVPISAMHGINIDALIGTIEEVIPTPMRDPKAEPLFFVARSFDINRPGSDPLTLKGGVLGGAVKQGTFAIGETIQLVPGYEVEERNKKVWKPITTTIKGLMTGGTAVDRIQPGGSCAIMTELDPAIVKADALIGAVVGHPGKLPPVHSTIKLKAVLLERMVGSKEELKIDPVRKAEVLMLNVNSAATVCVVSDVSKNIATIPLKRPICAYPGSRVTISRRVENRFRLIGYGILQ